ncbi:MAG: hypothetical protein ABSG74_10370 [Candidatus Bathyarchaeia archaeon]
MNESQPLAFSLNFDAFCPCGTFAFQTLKRCNIVVEDLIAFKNWSVGLLQTHSYMVWKEAKSK